MLAALIINERLKDDQGATGGQCLIGLGHQPDLLLEIPVMEDLAHDEHIGGRQWVLEEVARVEAHPLAQSKRPHVVLEDGANRRQIEPAPREMAMCEGHLHWQSPLRRDRKSTRLNSSHVRISYAVFCLKKKRNRKTLRPFKTKTYHTTLHIYESHLLSLCT